MHYIMFYYNHIYEYIYSLLVPISPRVAKLHGAVIRVRTFQPPLAASTPPVMKPEAMAFQWSSRLVIAVQGRLVAKPGCFHVFMFSCR